MRTKSINYFNSNVHYLPVIFLVFSEYRRRTVAFNRFRTCLLSRGDRSNQLNRVRSPFMRH